MRILDRIKLRKIGWQTWSCSKTLGKRRLYITSFEQAKEKLAKGSNSGFDRKRKPEIGRLISNARID